ncbi:Acetyltransferase, GNAT family [Lysobacter dokdonensis DS-58]|uniref:Acetyltransferase, GNAT family n=1 Tax=Lysobacter dokdonensis DS-58 TaxID=1300345 RepID=A0A0A2WN42_9GAMM|nr:GNAT family N-acetyltransferase [Lysobacter dokdonensis]KGQ19670.1 Acetyltransferase, GNAT family [Lysobacter dokdonensis DS-58]
MNAVATASTTAITRATPADLPRLLEVWETAVRATHDFLPAGEIDRLRPLVRDALGAFEPLHVLRDARGQVFAFLGVAEGSIEMLFVHADHRGCGAGRRLVEHALDALSADRVDVNEQNVQGVGFYRRLGFRLSSRSPLDGQGQPYPILHLVRDGAPP